MDELEISVVVPAKNEKPNLAELCEKLVLVLESLQKSFEIIFVDDGSVDGTFKQVKELAKRDSRVRGVKFARNYGKAMALRAGFEKAKGKIIISMDADLQDDPVEIPRFLQKIEEGYDLVSGWKKRRHDPTSRVLFSRIFNFVISRLGGVRLRDFNCGFKAYKSWLAKELELRGELHRFIPLFAYRLGARIAEIEVVHHPRKSGRSKYGPSRYLHAAFDIFSALLFSRFYARPLHLFGILSFAFLFFGLLCFVVASLGVLKLGLLFFGTALIAGAIGLFGIGLTSELWARDIFEAGKKYRICESCELGEQGDDG